MALNKSPRPFHIEKRSIGKVLNVGNVIAMAIHADSKSLDTFSAKLLQEVGSNDAS